MKTVLDKRKNGFLSKGKRNGFTLVELIVTLVILAVISAVAVPSLLGFIDEGKAKECEAQLKALAADVASMKMAAEMDGEVKIEGETGGTEKTFGEAEINEYLESLGEKAQCPVDGQRYVYKDNKITCPSNHGDVDIPSGEKVTVKLTEPSPEPSAKPTATPVPTAMPTPEPTATPTETPEPTATPTSTATPTATPAGEPTAEPTATPTPTTETGSTENPTPEPTTDPASTPADREIGDDAYVEFAGCQFEAGTWEKFRKELVAWNDQYLVKDGKDPWYALQLYTEIDPVTGEKKLYVLAPTSMSRNLDGTETIAEYNEKNPGTKFMEVNYNNIYDYEKLGTDGYPQVHDMASPGTVLFYNGWYYVAAPRPDGSTWFNVRSAEPYGNNLWWPLRPYCNIPLVNVEISNTTYTNVVEAQSLEQLDETQTKWFDVGELLKVGDKLYFSTKITPIKGGAKPEDYLQYFMEIDTENEVIVMDDEPNGGGQVEMSMVKYGQIVRWKGRDYVCINKEGANVYSAQWRQNWRLLR